MIQIMIVRSPVSDPYYPGLYLPQYLGRVPTRHAKTQKPFCCEIPIHRPCDRLAKIFIQQATVVSEFWPGPHNVYWSTQRAQMPS